MNENFTIHTLDITLSKEQAKRYTEPVLTDDVFAKVTTTGVFHFEREDKTPNEYMSPMALVSHMLPNDVIEMSDYLIRVKKSIVLVRGVEKGDEGYGDTLQDYTSYCAYDGSFSSWFFSTEVGEEVRVVVVLVSEDTENAVYKAGLSLHLPLKWHEGILTLEANWVTPHGFCYPFKQLDLSKPAQ